MPHAGVESTMMPMKIGYCLIVAGWRVKILCWQAIAVADANKKEKEAAVAAAKAAAAVAEAGDNIDQSIAAAKEAAQEAQEAAAAASLAAEVALKEAQKAKDNADAAREAMANRGAAAAAGLAAVNAENNAWSQAHQLEEEAFKLEVQAAKLHRTAAEKKMKLDGDNAMLKRSQDAASTVQGWYDTTVQTHADAETALDELKARNALLKGEWQAAKTAEQDALAALPIAKTDMDEATKISKQTEEALEKIVEARRKAWTSAYKTETANKHLTTASDKMVKLTKEEKDSADAKLSKASTGVQTAEGMLEDKAAKYAIALQLLEDAKDSGDMEVVATAERAADAANAAKTAAQAAKSAATVAYTVVESQCQKKVEAIQALDAAVQDIGSADASVEKAMALGTELNTMMATAQDATKKTKDLMEEAIKEHDFRAEDLADKTKNRKKLDLLISSGVVEEQRKERYLVALAVVVATWKPRNEQVHAYVPEVQAIVDETSTAHDEALQSAQDYQAAIDAAMSQHAAAQTAIDNGVATVKAQAVAAGPDMVAKLLSRRGKWARIAADNGKARRAIWDATVNAAIPVVEAKAKAEAAAIRVYEKLVAEQDNLEAEAVGPRNEKKISLVQKQEEEVKLTKELATVSSQLAIAQSEQKHWQSELERLEKVRRESSLEALGMRVESIWRKRSKRHDPDNKRRLERSVFSKITAAWDRDGTPLGPGKLDSWYLDATKITFAHQNEPGFMSEGLISRCSSACSEYADLQCNEGRVSRSCTRGQVFRTRYTRSGTIDAQNDWFICRCNTGVMQFAGRETLDVVRQKNHLMKASISPEQITFDTRLHAEEMMPDNHVHCFRDFEEWLTKKTPFAQETTEAFAELDALALSKPTEAVAVYNKVKKLWYEECLKEQVPTSPAADTYPGSTDSSLDIFQM